MADLNQAMGYSNMGNNYQRNNYQTQIPNQQYPYYSNNLQQMNMPYDNYVNRNQMMQQNNNTNQFFKCRPVSSEEEARASQIDLDGSLWVFTDIGNEKIYTKQISADGTSVFKTYILTQNTGLGNSSQYVTKEEFNSTIQTLMATIQQQQNLIAQETLKHEQSVSQMKF